MCRHPSDLLLDHFTSGNETECCCPQKDCHNLIFNIFFHLVLLIVNKNLIVQVFWHMYNILHYFYFYFMLIFFFQLFFKFQLAKKKQGNISFSYKIKWFNTSIQHLMFIRASILLNPHQLFNPSPTHLFSGNHQFVLFS